MKRMASILVATLALCAVAHAAGPLRCGGKLISPGVPAVYVLEKCGNPKASATTRVPARARTASGFSRLAGISVSEQWVYDRGPGRFPAVLSFRDGRLIRIDYLPDRS